MCRHVLQQGSFYMTDSCTKCSCGAPRQIKGCPLLCFNRTLCVLVCLNCWLLSSQQLYVGMRALCFGAHRAVWGLCEHVWMVSHLLPFPCACTHVDTLSLTALYVPTRGTPYPLCLRVFIEQTLNTPWPPAHVYSEGSPVSVFRHRDQACLHSFVISLKPTRRCLFAGCVRDTVASEQVSTPRDMRVVQHPFHLDSLCGMDVPESIARKKKQYCWRLSRDVCWLLLSVTSLIYASWK